MEYQVWGNEAGLVALKAYALWLDQRFSLRKEKELTGNGSNDLQVLTAL
jgi:hypothetical protein